MTPLFESIGHALPAYLLRISLVMLVVWGLQRTVLARSSASLRHVAWAVALAAVLLLPALSGLLPAYAIQIRRVAPVAEPRRALDGALDCDGAAACDGAVISAPAVASTLPTPTAVSRVSAATLAGGLYLVGAIVVLARMGRDRLRVRHLQRDASVETASSWRARLAEAAASLGVRRAVPLLRASHVVPMTFGAWRPAILLPIEADRWDDARARAVLLHELAHVVRRDCLVRDLASLACAVAWVHPGVWVMARRMRQEQELACDDRVVAAGVPARGYAEDLLEIAHTFAHVSAPAAALPMARPSQLEARLRALVDDARSRRRPGKGTLAGLLTAGLVALLPLAVVSARVVTAAAIDPQPVAASSPAPVAAPAPAPVPVPSPAAFVAQPGQRSAVESSVGSGTWEIRSGRESGTVHLQMREARSNSGQTMRTDAFAGLAAAMAQASGQTVRFSLKRDAGTFAFTGVFTGGIGAGTFTFEAEPGFGAALAKRGFTPPTASEQYEMARHDVGFALVDALAAAGYTGTQTSDLIKAGRHGVTPTYVSEMATLGYRLGAVASLVTLRDHGVTPTYVREMAAQGYTGVPADAIRRARDHGVTPEFVKGLADAGYRGLPLEEAIRVRDHGVTPDYVRALRDHGYTPAIAELVRARDHGVSADYVTGLSGLGYKGTPLDLLVRMRDHGVSVAYVTELKAAGYTGVSPADLITLRDHGYTAARIARANTGSSGRLSVDALVRAARSGR